MSAREKIVLQSIEADKIAREVCEKHGIKGAMRVFYFNFSRCYVKNPYSFMPPSKWYRGEMTENQLIAFYAKHGLKKRVLREIVKRSKKRLPETALPSAPFYILHTLSCVVGGAAELSQRS